MQLPNWVIVAIAGLLVAAVAYDILGRAPPDEATAINNRAVLQWRSTEGALNAQNIKAAFRKAAASGLVRADLNLLLATDACDDVAFEALAKRGDSRAASFAATCLAAKARSAPFSQRFRFAGCTERMLELARIATSDDQAAEHMKFGWLLSNLRRGQGCSSQTSADRELLEAGARHLLRAHELGVPAAAARIGSLLKENPELVASLEVGSLLQQRPLNEWTQMAADEGHPASNCTLGADLTRAIEEGPRPVDMKRVRQATNCSPAASTTVAETRRSATWPGARSTTPRTDTASFGGRSRPTCCGARTTRTTTSIMLDWIGDGTRSRCCTSTWQTLGELHTRILRSGTAQRGDRKRRRT